MADITAQVFNALHMLSQVPLLLSLNMLRSEYVQSLR